MSDLSFSDRLRINRLFGDEDHDVRRVILVASVRVEHELLRLLYRSLGLLHSLQRSNEIGAWEKISSLSKDTARTIVSQSLFHASVVFCSRLFMQSVQVIFSVYHRGVASESCTEVITDRLRIRKFKEVLHPHG